MRLPVAAATPPKTNTPVAPNLPRWTGSASISVEEGSNSATGCLVLLLVATTLAMLTGTAVATTEQKGCAAAERRAVASRGGLWASAFSPPLYAVKQSSRTAMDRLSEAYDEASEAARMGRELWDDLAPPFRPSLEGRRKEKVARRRRRKEGGRQGLGTGEEGARILRGGGTKTDVDDSGLPFQGLPYDKDRKDNGIDETQEPKSGPTSDVVHFCFLVHGHRGLSRDLSYLQGVMTEEAALRRAADDADSSPCGDIVVHNAVCNEGQTHDGVKAGGERLAREMLGVIRTEMSLRDRDAGGDGSALRDVTVSVVGNSLGGLYGRYAVAHLAETAAGSSTDEENSKSGNDGYSIEDNDAYTALETGGKHSPVIIDGKYRVHYNVFCTTASPHLGVSRHTYLPVPRGVELGIGLALGDTGRDLFRMNDLVETMATCPTFLEPLRSFRKRIAYANAYGTDFPVPAQTAAFLCPTSDYPHHFVDGEDDWDRAVVDEGEDDGLIVATLHTRPADPSLKGEEKHVDDDIARMSHSLDSLGWKKVFVDIRGEIPVGVSLPRRLLHSLNGSDEKGDSSRGENVDDDDGERGAAPCPVRALRGKKGSAVESRDIANAMSMTKHGRVTLPVGHNMICAFSRSRLSSLVNRGGRPVMDGLASELVEDILSWKTEAEEGVALDAQDEEVLC